MNLCTRCLTPVGFEQGDELGRCPRCAAEQAVIEAARGLRVQQMGAIRIVISDDHDRLLAALAALDGDPT